MSEKTLKVKLVRSPYGYKPNQVKTLKALGLTKMHKQVVKVDNPQIRGMVKTVAHLVSVEEA